MKRTLLAAALLVSSVFGVTGCGSDDDVPPAESRIKNSTGDPALVGKMIDPKDLLPKDSSHVWRNEDLIDGIRRLSQQNETLRNPNMQVRSDPPVGKDDTGPWNQSLIEPDKHRDYDREEKLDLMRDHLKYLSYDLRGDTPNYQPQVSPWQQSTIINPHPAPDLDADGNLIRE